MRNTQLLIPCRHWRFLWMVFLMQVISVPMIFAQEVEAKAILEKDTILIGDQIHLTLEVRQEHHQQIWFPEYPDTLTRHIEILEQSPKDTFIIDEGQIAVRQSLLITSFDSGNYHIPGQAFRLEVDEVKGTIFTNPLSLQVLTMDVDTTKAIYDIKMPYDAPLKLSDIWPYIVMTLLVVFIAYMVWRWIRDRKRKKQGFIASKPLEPAHTIALRELDRLKEEKLWQNNQLKAYYIRLSEILRMYLENRYFIRAMEETTWEILQDLKKSGFNDNRLFMKLNNLLGTADLVKFAKWKPLPEENETALLDGYIFVNETKPVSKMSEPVEGYGSSETVPAEPKTNENEGVEIKSEKNG